MFVPYDGRSRRSGADNGCNLLYEEFKNELSDNFELLYLERSYADLTDHYVYHHARRAISQDIPYLLVGGDHSCSYASILACTSKKSKLDVIHLDAHHDC